MLTIVGNGPSRKDFDLTTLERWYGCNAIYRDNHTPELLFAGDIPMQAEIIESGYHKENKVAFGGWEPLEIAMLDMMKAGFEYSGQEQRVFINEDDDFFVCQGNEEFVDFLGFSSLHRHNIVMYNNPLLKNLFTGMSALGYALENKEPEIALFGFDALESGNVDNVYAGTDLYPYKYTEESRVLDAQRSQFIALLEYYRDTKVFFQKSLDDYNEIDYTGLDYYENSDRWILGFGLESDTMQ
jgi:hypothetical protein